MLSTIVSGAMSTYKYVLPVAQYALYLSAKRNLMIPSEVKEMPDLDNPELLEALNDAGAPARLRVVEGRHLSMISAHGIEASSPSLDPPVILTFSGHYQADKAATTFSAKHELGHLKAEDGPKSMIVSGVAALAAAVLTRQYCSSFVGLVATYLTTKVAHSVFMRYREGKADAFAIKHASNEELKGGIRLFKAMQQDELAHRNQSWVSKILVSDSGDNWTDWAHPSATSRIRRIEEELRNRGENPGEVDSNKVQALLDIRNEYTKFVKSTLVARPLNA